MRKKLGPAQTVFLGFLLLVLLGTFLLSLPAATRTGERAPFVDALFTANSAVCVTGLIVSDTGQYWSLFGQIVILVLIQFGGLGYMTTAGLLVLMLRHKITMEEKLALKEGMDQLTMADVSHFLKQIVKFTFLVEGVGAVVLSTYWYGKFGMPACVFQGIFHSISALCNAGFCLFSNNLESYTGDMVVSITIMVLVVIGGLGYTVIRDLYRHYVTKKELGSRHLLLHTKAVLFMTFILIAAGAFGIFIIESLNPGVFLELTFKEKILSSLFQAITPRTAGFSTLPIGQLAVPTLMLMMFLMFVGASPGGTGGGAKTTTLLVLVCSAWSTMKRRRNVNLFGRRISDQAIRSSLAIFVMGVSLIAVIAFFMLNIEDKGFLPILFEIFSAFGTVGLSTGITPHLNSAGKLLLVLTMFIGRIGLLTFGVAIARQGQKELYRYPEEKILVG